MARITLNGSIQDISQKMSEGNPGCIQYLCELFSSDPIKAFKYCLRYDAAELYGSRLYQFWNDCCGRNIEIVHKVMEQYDDEEILRHIDNGKGYGTPFEIKEVM